MLAALEQSVASAKAVRKEGRVWGLGGSHEGMRVWREYRTSSTALIPGAA